MSTGSSSCRLGCAVATTDTFRLSPSPPCDTLTCCLPENGLPPAIVNVSPALCWCIGNGEPKLEKNTFFTLMVWSIPFRYAVFSAGSIASDCASTPTTSLSSRLSALPCSTAGCAAVHPAMSAMSASRNASISVDVTQLPAPTMRIVSDPR